MGQICSFCKSICCCYTKVKPKREPKTKDRDIQFLWTVEYKVPDNKFEDVFQEKGYDYKNKKFIAQGGSAKVFKIIRVKDGKCFALKEIPLKGGESQRDPTKFENLKNEIFVISKIKHKNIIELCDHFIINNTCFLIMQFANSGTVEQEVNKFGPMTEIKAKTYFIQIVKAIEHLHLSSPPIAHGDLKLANILIHIQNNEKILKVTDFGFSRVLTEKSDKKTFRAKYPEHGRGTAPYMSPQLLNLILYYNTDSKDRKMIQQIVGKPKSVNLIKADIWSLGVCLYFMICGKFPFDIINNDFLGTIKQQMNRKRKPIDKKIKISKELNQLLDRLLEPKAYRRIDISGVIRHQWLSGV